MTPFGFEIFSTLTNFPHIKTNGTKDFQKSRITYHECYYIIVRVNLNVTMILFKPQVHGIISRMCFIK
uniref:Uncharacterized protein n=1 Tax=Rhizophagus irregularis (strain DAOM 181602 / DAOM 197198 / MUCL 43194) TaxID=747089 RepID=U9TNA4_RHIID